jgi:hypothetical protein
MRVVDIWGDEICVDSIQDLESVLQRRDANGANAFWLSHDARFPVLVVLVKDDVATVQYGPGDREAGWMSVGNLSDGITGGLTRFDTSQHPAGGVFIMNETLLPFSVAVEAAKEFFLDPTPPQSVEWLKL